MIGARVAAGADHSTLATWLGFVAVVLATINVVGGFLVTGRMLAMFTSRKSDRRPPDPEAKSCAGWTWSPLPTWSPLCCSCWA